MQAECRSAGVPEPVFSTDMSGLMIENSHITIPELAQAIGVSTRAIEKQISNLRESGRLKRVGPTRGGYWEVIIEDDNK